MSTVIRRKLYKRGSSFETTIPMPLLFALNKDIKYDVLFIFDEATMRWYVDFEISEKLGGLNVNNEKNSRKRELSKK